MGVGTGPTPGRAVALPVRLRARPAAARPAGWAFGTATVAALAAALWVNLSALTVPSWLVDELTYRDAGWSYLHGNLTPNREHPPLAKYLIGLAELVVGRGPQVRVVAVLASLTTAAVLAAFATRLAGRWAGLGAFAAWALLPHGDPRLDQLLFLDVVMAAFATGALYAAWRRHPWLAGILLGAAAASKPPGILVAPAVLVLAGARWKPVLPAAAAAGLAAYAPYGTAIPATIRYLLVFQHHLSAVGHPVRVAGQVYRYPPWWSHLWWQWSNLTPPVFTVLVGAAVVGAVMCRPRRLGVGLALAVLVPFAALSYYPVKLPYYYYDWQPQLTLLAVLGLAELTRRRPASRRTLVRAVVGVTGVAVLAAGAGVAGAEVAGLAPRGYALLPAALARVPRDEPVAVWGQTAVARAYLPGRPVTPALPPSRLPAVVVVEPSFARRFPAPALAAWLHRHPGPVRRLPGGVDVQEVPAAAANSSG